MADSSMRSLCDLIDLNLILQTMPLMPLNRLASRLRRSVEGLNLELEEVFVSEKPNDQHEVMKTILFQLH